MKRIRVALNPPRGVYPFVVFARNIATCLSGDPIFSPPPGSLATLESAIAALDVALAAALSRRVGASTERKARQSAVLAALQVAQNYVQTLVSTLPPAEAVMVVARAGMDVKDAKGPTRAALTVKPGPTSGSALAYARAAKARATYEWQLAREGGDWEPVASIPLAKVTLEGLAVGTLIEVRVRPVLGTGPLDWLGPVSYRVV